MKIGSCGDGFFPFFFCFLFFYVPCYVMKIMHLYCDHVSETMLCYVCFVFFACACVLACLLFLCAFVRVRALSRASVFIFGVRRCFLL